MSNSILHDIYDCVIKIGTEHLDLTIKGFDVYLNEETVFQSAYDLLDYLESICNAIDNGVEFCQANKLVIRGRDFVGRKDVIRYPELRNMYNQLIEIDTKRKTISCKDANGIFPCYEKFISDDHKDEQVRFRKAAKCNLPDVDEPVLVLLTNGCVGIDWVNEPDSETPFAHYNVVGWTRLSGSHFEIVRKELK